MFYENVTNVNNSTSYNDDKFLQDKLDAKRYDNEQFINMLLEHKLSNFKGNMRHELKSYLLKHPDMIHDVEHLLEVRANEENQDLKSTYDDFLMGLIHHPNLKKEVNDFFEVIRSIKNQGLTDKDIDKIKKIAKKLEQPFMDVGKSLEKLAKEKYSDLHAAAVKYVNAHGQNEEKESLTDFTKVLKHDVKRGDVSVMGNNKKLSDSDDNTSNVPSNDVYATLDRLLNSGDFTNLGMIFMLLICLTLLTRTLQGVALKDLAENNKLSKKAQDLKQFLSRVSDDMQNWTPTDLANKGKMYDFIQDVLTDTTGKYSEQMKAQYKKDIQEFCPEYFNNPAPDAKEFAIALQKNVSSIFYKIERQSGNKGNINFPIDDQTGEIVFPLDNTDPKNPKIKLDFFTQANTSIGDATSSISTMETTQKSTADNAGATSQAANSLLSAFTTQYGQTLKGQ